MLRKKIAAALTATIVSVCLTGSALAAPIPYGEELKSLPTTTPIVSFSDISQTHWGYQYIAEMVNKKILDGYPDGKFRPENTISRAEFATIIIKAAGLEAKKVNSSSFSDIKITDWYSPFVETAKDYLTGYRAANGDYIYNPTAPALREDIAVAVVKLKGYDKAKLANRSIIQAMFRDYESISENAKDYVAIAVENGLVSGYEDETFRAQATITRAEAAALLWRAFQYGNDNKGVGGQGNTSTNTPSETQPPKDQSSTAPVPGQPEQSMKFSVDTLVGGIGQGDVDGSVMQARINQVNSMVVDKEDNIYFLDGDKKKVRKFNKANGTVETFRTMDASFDWSYKNDKKVTLYEHDQFVPTKLGYDSKNNKVLLMGNRKNGIWSTGVVTVYEIQSSVQAAVYNFGDYKDRSNNYLETKSIDVLRTLNDGSIVYSITQNHVYYNSMLLQAQYGTEAKAIAKSNDNTGISLSSSGQRDLVQDNNNIFILDGGNSTLSKIQLFPRKVEEVAKFGKSFDSVIAYNGKFYATSGIQVYEISLDGKLSLFIDGKNLTYNDGSPIERIDQISFDSKGNIILYDNENKAIRRINL